MTLDEMEELADLLANHYDSAAVHTADAAVDLARALLSVLPVVRSAEAVDTSFRGAVPTQRDAKRAHYAEQGARLSRLRHAIDAWRKAEGNEGGR